MPPGCPEPDAGVPTVEADGPRVEADSALVDGRQFRDIDGLKKLLVEDRDQLARSLTEKLLIYATGRGPKFSDRAVVKEIVAHSLARNYGLRSLIHEIVQSGVFLDKEDLNHRDTETQRREEERKRERGKN